METGFGERGKYPRYLSLITAKLRSIAPSGTHSNCVAKCYRRRLNVAHLTFKSIQMEALSR